MINALKWLVKFLETRFPEKVQPVALGHFNVAMATWDAWGRDRIAEIEKLQKQVEAMEKHIEVLNLRVGLSRPIQTVLRSNKHG